jgi:hypothetical protein
MKRTVLLVVFLLLANYTFGQFDNTAVQNVIRPDSNKTRELHFNFYNFNYVRNYEYTNKFHDGYTLFGTQLEPQLVYFANPNLVLSAGAFIRKDFGRNGVQLAKPLFSLKYQKRALTLVFGSLEGSTSHNYIEPLYDFERRITNPVEYGTQLLIEREKFKLDAWIAWQHMIYPGDAAKEEIIGGVTAESTLAESGGWKLSVPAQVLAFHAGGQIDVLKSVPLSTLFNGATGLKLHKTLNGSVKSLYTDNYIAVYKDFSPTKRRPYQGGFGIWLNAGIDTHFGSLLASYWKGNKFISIKGMPLYESVSSSLNYNGYTQSSRNVLSLRYAYQKELIPNLYLDLRFEPHVDLDYTDKQLQFNHSFFLTYKADFRVFKVKN